MQMTNLPFLTQIFLQMVGNNDLSVSFLYFDKYGPTGGTTSAWTEVWYVRAGQPCLTSPEWLWTGVNQRQTMQWLERGGSGPWTESRCGLQRPGLQSQPCQPSVVLSQRSHSVPLSLNFLIMSNEADSNPCLPGP